MRLRVSYLKSSGVVSSETQAIDAVHFETNGGPCVLTLRDPWDWSDRRSHLEALLNKLWFYFDYIDEADLVVAFPKAIGRELMIEIDALHPLPAFDGDFIGELKAICALYHVKLRYRPIDPVPDSAG
jgi:hypothetical protein